MGLLNRESFSKIKMTIGEPFLVSGLDGEVLIKKFSGQQRADILLEILKMDDEKKLTSSSEENLINTLEMAPESYDFAAKVIATCICDDQGLLFNPNCPDDVEQIKSWDDETIMPLFNECLSRNGLKTEAVKDEIKNSETTQNADSIID